MSMMGKDTDEYDGKRYKPITDDMYSKKTSGFIEK